MKRLSAMVAVGAVGVGVLVGVVAQLGPVGHEPVGCVRAPMDGGTDCRRRGALLDGSAAYVGAGNVFPARDAEGSQCEVVERCIERR